jgi:molybdopterin synthase catalytic subunit
VSATVSIGEEPLSVDVVLAAVRRPGAGGVALFLGAVRDDNEGRAVTRLEYEAYETMALAEMRRITAEISARDPSLRLAVAHRVGTLAVGDLAVVCAASAPHRGEAFAACRRLIDEVKARVPIWKREWGPDGPYWVGWHDARCAHHDHASADRDGTK